MTIEKREFTALCDCPICGIFGGKIRYTPGLYLKCDRCGALLVPGRSRPVEMPLHAECAREKPHDGPCNGKLTPECHVVPPGLAGTWPPPPLSDGEEKLEDEWLLARRVDQKNDRHPLCHRFYGRPRQVGNNKYIEYICRFCRFCILWPEEM